MSSLSISPSRDWRGCAALFIVAITSCVDPPDRTGVQPQASKPATGVLLQGSFQTVAKPVEGSVALVKSKVGYELVLKQVKVNDDGPVHVYLVGLDQVRSTADLDKVDQKYDFGPLDVPSATEAQHITLPGKPADSLRSVALVNPRFGVVLGSSKLTAPTK